MQSAIAGACSGNLRLTGTARYAPPGCADGTFESRLTRSTSCSFGELRPASAAPSLVSSAGCADLALRGGRVDLWIDGELLFTERTDSEGRFEFCLENSDPGFAADFAAIVLPCDHTGSDPGPCLSPSSEPFSVAVTAASGAAPLMEGTPAQSVCTGTVDWQLTDRRRAESAAHHVFDLLANDAYAALATEVGWINDQGLFVRVGAPTTGYSTSRREVDVALDDVQDPDRVLRAYAFFVLHDSYGYEFPPVSATCGNSAWGQPTDPSCAWIRGAARFLQGAMQRDPIFLDTTESGSLIEDIDLEAPDPVAGTRSDEGSVAATLWDLYDAASDPGDGIAFGLAPLWDAFGDRPVDVCELHDLLRADAAPNADTDSIFDRHDIGDCPIRYAALGDSYSSGEGVLPFQQGTGVADEQCRRSERAYSSLLQPPGHPGRLRDLADPRNRESGYGWDFIACSGARTINVVEAGAIHRGELPQLAQTAVTAETDLVTISIGGNDVNFGPLLERCIAAPACHEERPVSGNDGTLLELERLRLGRVAVLLDAVYRGISTKAPNASVAVLAYPEVLGGGECLGVLDGRISRDEQAALRLLNQQLNRTVFDAARRHGLHFVPMQRFNGHGVCGAAGNDWIRGADIFDRAASFHPTAEGQRQMALAIEASFRNHRGARKDTGLPRTGAASSPAALASTPAAAPPDVEIGALSVESAPLSCDTRGAFVPGQTVRLIGDGFAASADVSVRMGSPSSELGAYSADSSGRLLAEIDLPATLEPFHFVPVDAQGAAADGGTLLLIATLAVGPPLDFDGDEDGMPDACDSCPEVGGMHIDTDADGLGDGCDSCPNDADDDVDADGVCAPDDSCPFDAQNDVDADGVCANADNCPLAANPGQADEDDDGQGDACEGQDCMDALDNDGDGPSDFGGDPGCNASADGSEKSEEMGCDNGEDDDGDGAADMLDFDCAMPQQASELPEPTATAEGLAALLILLARRLATRRILECRAAPAQRAAAYTR